MLSLCYLPTAGRLTVTVIKARNLKSMDIIGKSGKKFGNPCQWDFLLNFEEICRRILTKF